MSDEELLQPIDISKLETLASVADASDFEKWLADKGVNVDELKQEPESGS